MSERIDLDECEAIAKIAYLPQDMTLQLIARCRELESVQAQLPAAAEAEKRDAERYRFIRATTKAVRDDNGGGRVEVTPEEFDAMTDAAIAAQQESGA